MNDDDAADAMFALHARARRYLALGDDISTLEERMRARAAAINPALLAIKGVGPVIGAQLLITAGDNPNRLRSSASFAALCGTAPIRTDRHRLSRGGDRQANAALHHIVKVRMSYDPATHDYRDRHLEKGWTVSAVSRTLKRAVAGEIFQALTGNCAVPDYSDPGPARRAKNLTLTTAAPPSASGHRESESLNSAADPTTTSPSATAKWLTAA